LENLLTIIVTELSY